MAGCFAAIKAREQGASVVLVDKGYVSRSGETPYAGDTAVFNPAWGHDLEQWLTQVSVVGEYLNNRHWNEIVFRDSYARLQDMRSWGVGFSEEDGEPAHFPHPFTQAGLPDSDKFPPLVNEVVHLLPKFPEIIRKQVVRSGAKIIDRFMVAELLQQDGRVVGALGFHLEGNEMQVIQAKGTVICAGGGGFRPVAYPSHELTGDGHVMAYRAGAVITGKEFVWPHRVNPDHPAWPPVYLRFSRGMNTALPGGRPKRTLFNAEGDEVPMRGVAWHGWLDAEYEAHEGRAPMYLDIGGRGRTPLGGPGNHGSMLGHAAGGICPVDDDCATHVPGLYAAGDSCGTCFVGAAYAGFGFATMHAAVTGARSGAAAARLAGAEDAPMLDERLLAEARERTMAPIERRGGFSPRWVAQVLQNALAPYFVLFVKRGDRLRTALDTVEYLRDHMVPKLYARDDHELRLAHETKSMVANAEMKLRASMFRTESRGNHYREDYLGRDDSNWLAWVRLKQESGAMKVYKEQIPDEWRPDPAKPYVERYPMRLPGEATETGVDADRDSERR
jgi:succinate dehydrogenase/fumarate reductase flavoprotein subunit